MSQNKRNSGRSNKTSTKSSGKKRGSNRKIRGGSPPGGSSTTQYIDTSYDYAMPWNNPRLRGGDDAPPADTSISSSSFDDSARYSTSTMEPERVSLTSNDFGTGADDVPVARSTGRRNGNGNGNGKRNGSSSFPSVADLDVGGSTGEVSNTSIRELSTNEHLSALSIRMDALENKLDQILQLLSSTPRSSSADL